jgi:hypothetical protein
MEVTSAFVFAAKTTKMEQREPSLQKIPAVLLTGAPTDLLMSKAAPSHVATNRLKSLLFPPPAVHRR